MFTVWDVGGQEKLRPLWRHYFNNTDGLVSIPNFGTCLVGSMLCSLLSRSEVILQFHHKNCGIIWLAKLSQMNCTLVFT